MTIRKGEDWGWVAPLPEHGVVAASDAEARAVIERARRAGHDVPPIGLTGGDLWRTMGAPVGGEQRLRSPAARTLPVDLGEVLVDGLIHWFVAHLVVRGSGALGWWRGRTVLAMNAEFHGDWDVAPRGHPNDGRLDLFDADLAPGQRWHARRRLPTGRHVPHPGITTRRVDAVQMEFDQGRSVWLDGERVGAVSNLSLRVRPDALRIVV